MDDLCGSSRSRVLVTARQIAMYLCRELTDLSLPKIGQHFGGRDHTTVMHADRKIRSLMAERRSIYNQVTELTNRIKSQARQMTARCGTTAVDTLRTSLWHSLGTTCGRRSRWKRRRSSLRRRRYGPHASSTAPCAARLAALTWRRSPVVHSVHRT